MADSGEDESDEGKSFQSANDIARRGACNFFKFFLGFKDVQEFVGLFSGEDDPIEKWIDDFSEASTLFEWTELQIFIFEKRPLTGLAKRLVQSEIGINS